MDLNLSLQSSIYGKKETEYSCYLYDQENLQKTYMWKDLMAHSEENISMYMCSET